MKKKRVGVRFFKAVITCMLLLVVIGLVGGIIFAKKIIDNTPDVSAEDIQPKGFTTTMPVAEAPSHSSLSKTTYLILSTKKHFLTEWNVNYKSSISLSHLKKR